MSKLARTLLLGATLMALQLAGVTAARAADQPSGDHRVPPTEGRVGEAWHQRQTPAEQPTLAGGIRQAPSEGQVGEAWRPRASVPAPPVAPSQPESMAGGVLGVLAAAVILAAAVGLLVAGRARRRARVGHAA